MKMSSTRMYVCESGEHPSTLLSGLNEQRLKGMLCDATVRVQGHLFKAHVNVLASSMGYFRDLFINSGKEKPRNIVEIPTIVNSTGFAKILDFVYTSQLCLSQSTVMQVLCSACYLQIPYVVEKCQEFITTHGHVTPSSLSEVTAPLLQNLQRGNFPKLSSNQLNNQSASASLSFLSQLNRLSEKSRARYADSQARPKPSSPQAQQDGDEQQECTLINTPPSPADRALAVVDRHRTSPNNPEEKDLTSLKRDRDPETLSNEDKQAAYSPQEKFSLNTNVSEEQPPNKRFVYTNPHQQIDYVMNGDTQVDRDVIDHKSLADYFSAAQTDKGVSEPFGPYSIQLNGQSEKNDYLNSDRQLVDLSKTSNKRISSILDSTIAVAQKKERPKKEYRCEYCGKMFGRQQHLKRHILTHTGERPYPCQYCEKRFRRSEHLKHHMANHEQAMGIEPTSAPRKKPRKPARNNDAYALSKLMLRQYGAPELAANRLMIDYGGVPAAPVILPSMFVDGDRPNNSPQATITEIDDAHAPTSDHNDEAHDHRQGSPSSYAAQSPMTALNLCRDAAKEQEMSASPMQQDGSVASDNIDGNSSEEKPAEVQQTSPGSHSPVMNGVGGMFSNNHGNSDLIGMEGSEVLTSDLKRLIAAMDE